MKLTTRAENRAAGIALTRAGQYLERKAAQQCTRPGCERPLAPGSGLCARHLRKNRRAAARSLAARRSREREAGRCAEGCGRKSETYRCMPCCIRLGRIPTVGVNRGVNNNPRQPGGVWRDDVNGWNRFRGRGKRGAPPAGANDEFDIRMIFDAIQKGTAQLAYARSPEVQQLGRITKQAELDCAAGYYAHAARGLDDLVDRLRKGR